jgi:hypothetical protein
MRFEQVDEVPPSHSSTLMQVKKALEAAGVEFIGTPEDGPGIRLRRTALPERSPRKKQNLQPLPTSKESP